MSKPKFLKKHHLPKRARDTYAGEEYVNGIQDSEGNQAIRALTEEEKEWLNSFNNGYCLNNHRKEKIFTDHDNYTTIKSELDKMTNIRNKEILLADLPADLDMDTNDYTNVYEQDSTTDSVKYLTFQQVIDNLIYNFSNQLMEIDDKQKRYDKILNFGLDFYKEISKEKREMRNNKHKKQGDKRD